MKTNFAIYLLPLLFLGLLLNVSCKGSKKVSITPPDVAEESPSAVFTPEPSASPAAVSMEERYAFADSTMIRKAQILLYLNGYETGRANGELSDNTKAALRLFEERLDEGGYGGEEILEQIGVNLMDFEVSDLQTALESKNYDPGPIDNFVGPMTRNAYTDFLQSNDLPLGKFTETIKTVLFSTNAKYKKPPMEEDPLFNPDVTETLPVIDFVPTSTTSEAKISEVHRALFARGYDPGPETESMTPQMEDALFKFQWDRKLPLGGLNPDTLRALGFGD